MGVLNETWYYWLPPGVLPTPKPFSVSENGPFENFLRTNSIFTEALIEFVEQRRSRHRVFPTICILPIYISLKHTLLVKDRTIFVKSEKWEKCVRQFS